MASKTIEQLDAITSVENDDLLLGLDVSDTTDSAEGTNKKFTFSSLVSSVLAKFLADETITIDGWTPISDTLEYASSSTVTIEGDHRDRFAVGDKIKFTQNTVKYFYVTAISYSAPDTILTLYAGSVHTVANAVVTSPYYSKDVSPVGFPQWFTFTPVWTNLTVGSGTNTGSCALIQNTLFFRTRFVFGAASAVGSSPILTLPITIKNYGSLTPIGEAGLRDDNTGTYILGLLLNGGQLFSKLVSGTTVAVGGVSATAPFTWAANDSITVQGKYEIA